MATDRELVVRARTGELDAFAILMKRYERSVLAVIRAEVRDPQMAQKVVLSTLRRAHRKIGRLDDESEFGPWLLKLAHRQTINALRTMPIPVGSMHEPADFRGDIEGADAEWIENEHLLGLLARLSDEERRLVALRFFDNHTPVAIAEFVDRPIPQVTAQISRAVARLQYRWEWEQE